MMFSVGCTQNKRIDDSDLSNTESQQSIIDVSKTKNIDELSKCDNFSLRSSVLLKNSTLLLCYSDETGLFKFQTYDLKSKCILNKSDEIKLENVRFNNIKLLSNYFYICSDTIVYVFDFSCKLVKEIKVPENTKIQFPLKLCISDDLMKIAYIKPYNETEYLYVADADGNSEQQVLEMTYKLFIDDMFFSSDKKRLGFSGGSCPAMEQQSIECYGYINIEEKKPTVFIDDDTYMCNNGDTMLICDDTKPYGAAKKGIIKKIDLSSQQKNEYSLYYPEDCDSVCLSSDPSYFVGMHEDIDNNTIFLTLYKNAQKISEIKYICSSYEELGAIGGSLVRYDFDKETKQIIFCYYDKALKSNTIKSLPIDF